MPLFETNYGGVVAIQMSKRIPSALIRPKFASRRFDSCAPLKVRMNMRQKRLHVSPRNKRRSVESPRGFLPKCWTISFSMCLPPTPSFQLLPLPVFDTLDVITIMYIRSLIPYILTPYNMQSYFSSFLLSTLKQLRAKQGYPLGTQNTYIQFH